MSKKMTDEEYGRHIRELNRKYYLRYTAIQKLKNEALKKAGIKISEDEIKKEIERLKKEKDKEGK